MSITTEDSDGSFSGTGYYAETPPPPSYTWNVSGTVSDDSVSMIITYNEQVGGSDCKVWLDALG